MNADRFWARHEAIAKPEYLESFSMLSRHRWTRQSAVRPMICMLLVAAMLAVLPIAASGATVNADETVSATGHADFRDVQAAIDALPADGGTIAIEPGTYRGRFYVAKPDVTLIGTGDRPQDVVLIGDQSAATTGSIYASATFSVASDDFRATNLTFANDWDADPSHGASQAVALAVFGDQGVFQSVRVLGGQDTLYLAQPPGQTTRQYFSDCYVAGHVDFIFGNARTYFDGCEIHGVDHEKVMYTAHARNSPDEKGAFVFHDCVFTAGRAPGGVYIGRPWRIYARVVLIDSRVVPRLAPGGWREWKPGLTHNGRTAKYAEYRTDYAHGAPRKSRIEQLDAGDAAKWSLPAFFNGDTAWIDRAEEEARAR